MEARVIMDAERTADSSGGEGRKYKNGLRVHGERRARGTRGGWGLCRSYRESGGLHDMEGVHNIWEIL